jgi:hypothetical protein
MQYMKASLLARSKEFREDGTIVEVVIWQVPEPVPPSSHRFKYRLFYGTATEARVRYDNERGKGDHRHYGQEEFSYLFITPEQLLNDFDADIEKWSAS